MYPRIADNIIYRRQSTIDGDVNVLYQLGNGEIIEINAAVDDVLSRCDGTRRAVDIAHELCAGYNDAPAKLDAAVRACVEDLAGREVVRLSDAPWSVPRTVPSRIWLSRPLDGVDIEVTQQCNLRCVHCYLGEPAVASSDMDTATLLSCVDQLAAMGVVNLTLTGGEAMLRPDLPDIIRHAATRPMIVRLLTNGTLVDAIMVRTLKEAGVWSVQVSLDGATVAAHDTYRGITGAFNRTCHAIGLMRDAGLTVDVGAVVNTLNVGALRDIVDLCRTWGIVPSFGMQKPDGRAAGEGRQYEVNYDRFAEALVDIQVYLRGLGLPDPPRSGDCQDRAEKHRCVAGIKMMSIRHNGDVYPCFDYSALFGPLGNVQERGLREIWNDESGTLGVLRRKRLGEVLLCGGCEHNVVCNGGCPVDAYKIWGHTDYPSLEKCAYHEKMKRIETV